MSLIGEAPRPLNPQDRKKVDAYVAVTDAVRRKDPAALETAITQGKQISPEFFKPAYDPRWAVIDFVLSTLGTSLDDTYLPAFQRLVEEDSVPSTQHLDALKERRNDQNAGLIALFESARRHHLSRIGKTEEEMDAQLHDKFLKELVASTIEALSNQHLLPPTKAKFVADLAEALGVNVVVQGHKSSRERH